MILIAREHYCSTATTNSLLESKNKEDSSERKLMGPTAIFIRGRKTFWFAVVLLFLADMAVAQNASVVSPPLTMRPGTTLTVRLNEPLSSDRNQVGDVFTASLDQPVIVLGIVV